ncbi:MAG: T9SS type A sorting domain-containing protein [Flavobacteriales bacterium]|nr:T9SS type A sorting domain-containing protein [Flavobacteriales bacterium]
MYTGDPVPAIYAKKIWTLTETGFDETESMAPFSLSPNPASDKVRLFWGGGTTASWITVLDAQGRVVYQAGPLTKANLELSVAHLATGLYTVTVVDSKSQRIQRLVVAR